MKEYKDIFYTKDCALDMYLPEKDGFSTIVFFHGGGFIKGDKAATRFCEIGRRFAECGYGFVSANYRTYSSGGKFPQFLEDGARAVAFVKKNIAKYGGDKTIYVGGNSAGAWLAVMLCLNGKYLKEVGIEPTEIKGWLIDSAQMTSHFNIQAKEKGVHPSLQRIDEFAPLYYVDERTAFSRMLLFFYEEDMPCRPEQNMLFYKSVLHFNPKADIEYRFLSGGHCRGSSKKDADGEYAYFKESLAWIQKEEI